MVISTSRPSVASSVDDECWGSVVMTRTTLWKWERRSLVRAVNFLDVTGCLLDD